MNLNKRQLIYISAVSIAAVLILAYLHLNESDPNSMVCCYIRDYAQRMCMNAEYLRDEIGMSIEEWDEAVNCSSEVFMCKFDPTVNDIVCPDQ